MADGTRELENMDQPTGRREGLGGFSFMGSLHPVTIALYYLAVIALTTVSNAPLFLLTALLAGCGYEALQKGTGVLPSRLLLTLVITVSAALVNGFFTHNGATVLFYLGPNRITKEAFCYGAVMALMIAAVIFWFGSFGVLMTADKMIYLFGHFAPVLGLAISMVFRFIPLLKRRFASIRMGQTALGRGEVKGFLPRIRQTGKEISILISWSLEASIDSADSMTARGYGLPGRTSYHLFRWQKRDTLFLLPVLFTAGLVVYGYAVGAGRLLYYPEIRPQSEAPLLSIITYGAFLLLLALPVAVDLGEEIAWKKSASGI